MSKDLSSYFLDSRHERPESNQSQVVQKTHHVVDSFTQGQVQPWFDLDLNQLSSGAYQGVCTTLSTESTYLVHEQQNRLIHKAGIVPKNICTVSFALGKEPGRRFFHFQDPEPLMYLLPQSTELDLMIPGQVDTLYFYLDQNRLIDGARSLNPCAWDSAPRGVQAYNSPEIIQLIPRLLSLLQLDAISLSSEQIETLLIDSILQALDSATDVQGNEIPGYRTHQRAIQRVNIAREFIDASLQAGQVPSITAICTQAGASSRSLEYAFRELMQMTPVAYLRTRRLNMVRRALRTSASTDATVTQIATRWGFLHLGKFAMDYRQLFGERPSETLQRGRVQ